MTYPSSSSSKNMNEHIPSEEQIINEKVEKKTRSLIRAKCMFPTTAKGVKEAVE